MKRFGVVLICALLLPVAAGAGRTPATLRIADQSPLVVKGAHFRANERVRVTASRTMSVTRVVSANGAGRFTVQFAQLSSDRCSGLLVRAVGSRGTMATAKLPQPYCPPAP